MMKRSPFYIFFFLCIFSFNSAQAAIKHPLFWDTPKEWTKISPKEGSLVTFVSSDKNNLVECNVIVKEGEAGGLRASINSWMNELHLPRMPEPLLDDFISEQEYAEFTNAPPIVFVDLTGLKFSLQNPPDDLMITATIAPANFTVIVKMTGKKDALIRNRDIFKKFCASIKFKK